jgi:hypothetical protein
VARSKNIKHGVATRTCTLIQDLSIRPDAEKEQKDYDQQKLSHTLQLTMTPFVQPGKMNTRDLPMEIDSTIYGGTGKKASILKKLGPWSHQAHFVRYASSLELFTLP